MRKQFKSSLSSKTPKIQRSLAKIVHITMYIVLAGVAISGLSIGYLFWLGFHNSALIEVSIWVHELLFSIVIWLISLHVLAAIYHRIQHDFVWSSMVPFLKEKDKITKQ